MKKKALLLALTMALAPGARAEDLHEQLTRADGLYAKGDLASLKAALPIYKAAVDAHPNNFEALWRATRGFRDYANRAKELQAKGWKSTCAEYGKKAMQYGERAIAAQPNKPHGHLWYGSAVGTYADGVSLFTALREGLKDKTQKAFESAYRIDKMYNEAGAILALGRFWSVLPWPMRDNAKALAFLREYRRHYPHNPEGQVYLIEVLIDAGGDGNEAEAKKLIALAKKSSVPFYRQRAAELENEL